MWPFSYNSDVSLEKVAKNVEFIDEATAATVYADRDLGPKNAAYTTRAIYYLDRGVNGRRHRVVGEYPAVIEYGLVDTSSDAPEAVVTVPVKGLAYRERTYLTVAIATMPEILNQASNSQEYISKLAIAHAVLDAANGNIDK